MTTPRQPADVRRAIVSGALLGTLLLGAFGTLYFRSEMVNEKPPLYLTSANEAVYMPGKLALRMGSIGYGPFASDLVFIRTHAKMLGEIFSTRLLGWFDTYLEAAITLDPDNAELYHYGARMVKYAQEINVPVIERAIQYAERGIERFPDDARLYANVAFNLYFELRPLLTSREEALQKRLEGETNSARRDELLQQMAAVRRRRFEVERRALENYTIAAMLPNSSVRATFLVTLYLKQDLQEAAVDLIRAIFPDVSSADRRELIARLKLMGRYDTAKELQRAQAAHKAEMPYVSQGFYAMLGSARDLRVPRTWFTTGEVFDKALEALESERREGMSP